MAMPPNYLHTLTSDSRRIHSETSESIQLPARQPRFEHIGHILDELQIDCLFSDNFELIYYLTGFRGSNGSILVRFTPAPLIYLCTDGRYLDQAADQTRDTRDSGVEVAIGREPILGVEGRIRELGEHAVVGTDFSTLRLANYLALIDSGAKVVDISAQLAHLRARKDASEIDAMLEAGKVADLAIDRTLEHLQDRPTELELAGWFEYYVREYSGEGVAFPTIVASGPRTALPHAQPSRQRIEPPTPVVIDFGAMVNGYRSDSTRSFYFGKPTESYRRAYECVRDAKAAGVAELLPGNLVNAVEVATRASLQSQGVEQYLLHGVGHGVGLEIHEFPFTATAGEVKIAPGMCITVEPGLYYQGDFGIRLEDLYLTTAESPVALTRSSDTDLSLG